MQHTSNLVQWWDKADTEGVHPEDLSRSDLDDAFKFKGMCPVPYLGDLTKARLVIVMLNPGLEEDERVRMADEAHEKSHLISALRQESGIGFWPLQIDEMKGGNPGGPGSRRYWRSIFRSYVASKADGNPESVYAEIARNICCVQLVPYHSKKGPNTRLGSSLKSVHMMREWITEEIRLAHRPLIIFRGWKYLEDIRGTSENQLFLGFEPGRNFLRRPSFNPMGQHSRRAALMLDKVLAL